GEPESNFVHPGFVNWPGHNAIEFAASGECRRLFERSGCGASSFRCRLTGLTIWLAPDDDIFSRIGNAARFQSKLNDLRSDSGAIAKCDSDAPVARAPAHTLVPARNPGRAYLLDYERAYEHERGSRTSKQPKNGCA